MTTESQERGFTIGSDLKVSVLSMCKEHCQIKKGLSALR